MSNILYNPHFGLQCQGKCLWVFYHNHNLGKKTDCNRFEGWKNEPKNIYHILIIKMNTQGVPVLNIHKENAWTFEDLKSKINNFIDTFTLESKPTLKASYQISGQLGPSFYSVRKIYPFFSPKRKEMTFLSSVLNCQIIKSSNQHKCWNTCFFLTNT